MFPQVIKPGGGSRPMRHGTSASSHEAVTPSDSNAFTGGTCTGVYVGVGGDVAVLVNGVVVTYKNVPTGFILPVEATRVNSTNTTATDMVAMFG